MKGGLVVLVPYPRDKGRSRRVNSTGAGDVSHAIAEYIEGEVELIDPRTFVRPSAYEWKTAAVVDGVKAFPGCKILDIFEERKT